MQLLTGEANASLDPAYLATMREWLAISIRNAR
jgi:hypothetical protein